MTTTTVSQETWIEELERRRARLENPVHQQMITTLVDYLRAGPAFDPEQFMGTMTDDVVFRRFGVQRGVADAATIRKHYEQGVTARIWPTYVVEMERLCFSDDGMAFDGVFRTHATLKDIYAHGHVKRDMIPKDATDEDSFLISRRLATFFTFRDGKIAVEDSYWDPVSIEIL